MNKLGSGPDKVGKGLLDYATHHISTQYALWLQTKGFFKKMFHLKNLSIAGRTKTRTI